MKIAVCGFGLIGRERVKAIQELRMMGQDIESLAIYDPYIDDKKRFSERESDIWLSSLEALVKYRPDWIVVSTPHDSAVALIERVLPLGCRVLMEKPFGRSVAEASRLVQMSLFPEQIWIGFNYRFYPGIARAIKDAQDGLFGNIISVTMVLGHGGSPGMEKGWKFDPMRAGGGCLIDPGIHLLDLCTLINTADIKPLNGWQWSGFWNTGIEEEVHLLLNCGSFISNLQTSVVRWRSNFRIEINGTEGYGVVAGRGRSYGPQSYFRGKRWGWRKGTNQAESEECVLTTEGNDTFRDELFALFCPERSNSLLKPCSAQEGLLVMKLFESCKEVLTK